MPKSFHWFIYFPIHGIIKFCFADVWTYHPSHYSPLLCVWLLMIQIRFLCSVTILFLSFAECLCIYFTSFLFFVIYMNIHFETVLWKRYTFWYFLQVSHCHDHFWWMSALKVNTIFFSILYSVYAFASFGK